MAVVLRLFVSLLSDNRFVRKAVPKRLCVHMTPSSDDHVLAKDGGVHGLQDSKGSSPPQPDETRPTQVEESDNTPDVKDATGGSNP